MEKGRIVGNMATQMDKSTQTSTQAKDFDVKVVVKYGGIERSKAIKNETEKMVIKNFYNNSSAQAVVKNFSKNKSYKTEMLKGVNKEIQKETIAILNKENPLFKVKEISHLTSFYWSLVFDEMKSTAPHLLSVLPNVIQKENLPCTVIAAAVLLYGRSQRLNQIQTILGLILDKCGTTKEGLKIHHDLRIVVSTSSIQNKKRSLVKHQQKLINDTIKHFVELKESGTEDEHTKPIEILGDNVDVTVTPSKMTMENQRKSLHWFLVMAKQKRITADMIDDVNINDTQHKNILELPTVSWLPTVEHISSLCDNFDFHISHILLKYIEFLEPVKPVFPKYIQHRFMDMTKKKSVFLNCNLVDASENSAQGMISILKSVHDLAVPHTRCGDKSILEKVVFGGDVLTNERAFSAQEAMQNNSTDFTDQKDYTEK